MRMTCWARVCGALVLAGLVSGVLGAGLGVVRPVVLGGIHNAYQLSERVYSGSQPEGDADFEALRELGVRTILSVDGSIPDAEAARRHGLRYVHLPVGYDGAQTNVVLQVVKMARVLEGRVFVHCHHGRHRGPAMAALVCRATEGWRQEDALGWLRRAGTSVQYPGLYRMVREFEVPSTEVLEGVSSDFPSVSRVSGLVEAMVKLDQVLERLREAKGAGWRVPVTHPDLVLSAEALLMEEQYRELRRVAEVRQRGEDFLEALRRAELGAAGLRERLGGEEDGEAWRRGLDAVFLGVEGECSACHKVYRNRE
ncbi:MAG: hypothetical protein RI897_1941 [Verrucomicrobiota bacterium]